MRVLVIGGTGTVGSQVVRELLQRKVDVVVLTRSAEKAKSLPTGVRPLVGDLLDPATVRGGFRDMDGVFLLNVVSAAETTEGLMGVAGIRLGRPKRAVYLSVQNADQALHLPHFAAKVPVEMALKASGVPWTILRPNNFYQNDAWFKQGLLDYGVYGQPFGDAGLSRVDVRDIAEAAAIALTTGGHEGQTYNLVGPDLLTGNGTAEIWSRGLGRKIAYAGDDLDPWERQWIQYLPPLIVFDYRMMYAYFQEHGLKANPQDIDRQTKLLGHAPRRYEDFVRETAASWK